MWAAALIAAFGKHEELVRLANHDLLATAFDPALRLPSAEDAAHGVQSCSGHLGHILSRDRKVDAHSFLDLAAGLLGKPQQRVRNAPLDLLGRHLDNPGVGLLQGRTPTVWSTFAARAPVLRAVLDTLGAQQNTSRNSVLLQSNINNTRSDVAQLIRV